MTENSVKTQPNTQGADTLVDVNLEDNFEDVIEQSVTLSLAVPTNEMMGEHESYHQSISGDEARRRLRKCGAASCYLTRYSENWRSYVLSVHRRQRPHSITKHFKILIENGRHRIEGKEDLFGDVKSLLAHYESNRFDPAFETIGRPYAYREYTRKKCVIQ